MRTLNLLILVIMITTGLGMSLWIHSIRIENGHQTELRMLTFEDDRTCEFQPIDNDPSNCPTKNCSYCQFKRCWARTGATANDDADCNPLLPSAKHCKDLSQPNPTPCPEGLDIMWNGLPEAQLKEGESFVLDATLSFGSISPVHWDCDGHPSLIPHANAHGCMRTATTWWCRDLIPAYQPKSVESSTSLCLNNTIHNQFEMTISHSTSNPPNEWTIYTHYSFYTKEENTDTFVKWHVTKGSVFLVQGKELEATTSVEMAVAIVASLVVVFPTFIFGIALWHYRTHWVIRSASWYLCELIVLGGFLASIAIYSFIPSQLNDFHCQLRQWLIPLGFDFIILPMTLKTWRVHKLFNTSLQRVKISNTMIMQTIAGIICIEILFNALWCILPTARLRASKKYSTLDPNAFEMECIAEDKTLQNIFTTISIVAHLIPCVALTVFAYQVRLSFKYSRVELKYHTFDESLYIMLSLLNLSVVGLFVIVFQSVISENPNAVTAMRGFGVAWIVFLTLTLMFLPKFIKVWNWDETMNAKVEHYVQPKLQSKQQIQNDISQIENTIKDVSQIVDNTNSTERSSYIPTIHLESSIVATVV